MKKIIICRGVAGSGKSSLAKELGKGGVVFSSDDFFMQGGKYNFNANQLGIAHLWNQNRVKDAMEKNEPLIVVDNTNTRLVECSPYVKLAKKYGYDVEFAEPNWSPELKTPEEKWNYDFIKGKSVHNVPDEVIKKMIDRFEYQNPGETKEEFIERVLKGE